ncbi:MAG: thiamine pyrophosphate-binding protein [Caldilineales bacterium]|nr:thiamine pyrophosphate-binding protein [Caldilineales bacterium]
MSSITGGELLLKTLKTEGVSMIFGVLDGSFNTWLAKLKEYDMGYVCPRHEAAGAHMAEAWARTRGEPGVTIGGIGPGAVNMSAGVAVAFAEGTPLIAISGQRRRNIIYPDRGGSFQVIDLVDFYRPITKWQASIRDLRRMPEIMRKAFRMALSGRPGPVYIEIPEDVIRSVIDEDLADIWPASSYRAGSLGAGDVASIERAADILVRAERPMFHAGGGVQWAGAWDEFIALGEHLGAGFTGSLGARGVVPEDHPRYFHPLNRDALEAARVDADLYLVVGSRLGELDGWAKEPLWGDAAERTTIQVDVDPTSIAINRPVDLALIGDARAVLAALLAAVQSRTAARTPHAGFERYAAMTAEWKQELEQALGYGSGLAINSGQMIRTVREFFPRDAIMVQDGGNTSLWCANYNPIYGPRSYLYTAKFGHLGTGLPYAIGAKMAAPDRPVYLITGDGALGFNIQELETARRHNVPIVIVVATDQGWGMERSSQIFAQIGAFVETELVQEIRYDHIAQAFGCHGEYVSEIDQLAPALQRAQASGIPALVQVMVDKQANLAPPGALIFGSMVYRAED